MSVPTHVIVIAPLAQIAACTEVLGLTPKSPLFTAADAPVRTETHRARSGPVSEGQLALVEAHLAGAHPDLAGVTCVKWLRSDPSPYEATLTALGLTQDNGNI